MRQARPTAFPLQIHAQPSEADTLASASPRWRKRGHGLPVASGATLWKTAEPVGLTLWPGLIPAFARALPTGHSWGTLPLTPTHNLAPSLAPPQRIPQPQLLQQPRPQTRGSHLCTLAPGTKSSTASSSHRTLRSPAVCQAPLPEPLFHPFHLRKPHYATEVPG